MTAPLSEAAAKLREEVAEAIGNGWWADNAGDRALSALGITWEQAAKLKSGEAVIASPKDTSWR